MKEFSFWNSLEDRVYSGEDIKITFSKKDKIELKLVLSDKSYIVKLVAPWRSSYTLGIYTSEESAHSHFKKFDNYLNRGYPLHITSIRTAEIVGPGILERLSEILFG